MGYKNIIVQSLIATAVFIHQVSEKRMVQLNEYLQSLLKMDSIVAEVCIVMMCA